MILKYENVLLQKKVKFTCNNIFICIVVSIIILFLSQIKTYMEKYKDAIKS